MDRALSEEDIVQLASFLAEDERAISKKFWIYALLGLPLAEWTDFSKAVDRDCSGSYGFFVKTLLNYKSMNGLNFGVEGLVKCLTKLQLFSVLDKFQGNVSIDDSRVCYPTISNNHENDTVPDIGRVLSREAALKFLREELRTSREDELKELIEKLQCLSIPLHQAVDFMRSELPRGTLNPIKKYLEIFESAKKEIDPCKLVDLGNDKEIITHTTVVLNNFNNFKAKAFGGKANSSVVAAPDSAKVSETEVTASVGQKANEVPNMVLGDTPTSAPSKASNGEQQSTKVAATCTNSESKATSGSAPPTAGMVPDSVGNKIPGTAAEIQPNAVKLPAIAYALPYSNFKASPFGVTGNSSVLTTSGAKVPETNGTATATDAKILEVSGSGTANPAGDSKVQSTGSNIPATIGQVPSTAPSVPITTASTSVSASNVNEVDDRVPKIRNCDAELPETAQVAHHGPIILNNHNNFKAKAYGGTATSTAVNGLGNKVPTNSAPIAALIEDKAPTAADRITKTTKKIPSIAAKVQPPTAKPQSTAHAGPYAPVILNNFNNFKAAGFGGTAVSSVVNGFSDKAVPTAHTKVPGDTQEKIPTPTNDTKFPGDRQEKVPTPTNDTDIKVPGLGTAAAKVPATGNTTALDSVSGPPYPSVILNNYNSYKAEGFGGSATSYVHNSPVDLMVPEVMTTDGANKSYCLSVAAPVATNSVPRLEAAQISEAPVDVNVPADPKVPTDKVKYSASPKLSTNDAKRLGTAHKTANVPATAPTTVESDIGITVLAHQEVLTEQDALKYVLGHIDTAEDLTQLTTTLKCLKIPLQHAVAFIQNDLQQDRTPSPVNKYLELFGNATEAIDPAMKEYLKFDQGTVYVTVNLNLNSLKKKEFGQFAIRIIELISYLDPNEPVPIRAFLKHKLLNWGWFFKRVTPPEHEVEGGFRLLKAYSMIDTGNDNEAVVLPIVQSIVQLGIGKRSKSVLEEGLELVLKNMDPDYSNEDMVKSLLPHAISLWTHSLNYAELIQKFGHFPSQVCQKLNYYKNYNGSLKLAQNTKSRIECVLGNTHEYTIRIKYHEAESLWWLKQYSVSLNIARQIQSIASMEFGYDDELTLNISCLISRNRV